MTPRVLVITGPTAAGKTDLALEAAQKLSGEIICVDSLTVYRGLDIGSAKPSIKQRAVVPHHLLDIREPTDQFSAADFRREALAAVSSIVARGKRPIFVGGTGLYLRVVLRGLTDAPAADPEVREHLYRQAEQHGVGSLMAELFRVDPVTAARVHPNNLVRIIRALEVHTVTGLPLSRLQHEHGFGEHPFEALQFCLAWPRDELYRRIERRVDTMLAAGLIDEVRGLLAAGIPPDCKPLQAIGYREIVAYLREGVPLADSVELIKRSTRRFAKRQLTWFKAEPGMQWVAYPENSATILETAARFFA